MKMCSLLVNAVRHEFGVHYITLLTSVRRLLENYPTLFFFSEHLMVMEQVLEKADLKPSCACGNFFQPADSVIRWDAAFE